MKKKILSLVLALLMSFSSAAMVSAAEEDTTEASPYAFAVEFLNNYGIYKGEAADDFAAEKDIQRYQMALFVARISTGWVDDEKWEDGPENTSIFKDLDSAPVDSYLGAISYANQKGIIEGYGNGEFGPYDGITYQNALTMVARTLGYTGLDWPWGYIQTSVELGLTKGIEGVAYTDILTRGEVAQIIYNALFVPVKGSTETLAAKYFGVEFGWETILVTASDRDVYEKGGVTTPTDSNKKDAWVSFKLYNEDGTVDTGKDAVTYYALAEELGLNAEKHEDELAVGHTYLVLFEKDADSNFVTIKKHYDTVSKTIWNSGKTDDAKEAQAYDIQAYLDGVTLVTKYTPANYINNTRFLKPEVIVYNALATITEEVKGATTIAIDWNTGDILVPCDEEDADITADGKFYEVAWYWNSTLENYYKFKKGADGEVVGIDWMTEEEFAATYEAYREVAEVTYTGFNKPITSIAKTAYASLTLENVDFDKEDIAERGLYEEYGFGYFANASDVYCSVCDSKGAGYTLTTYSNDISTGYAEDGVHSSKGTVAASTTSIRACAHGAWFADGFAPSTDEDGAYLDGFVIFSYDADTKEIKIVKEIDNGTDADSFVEYGVLRGYSPLQKTVIVDDTTYTTNYDELKGTGFYKTKDNYKKYTAGLDSMLNQFVKIVVVDGEVVYMHLEGEITNDYLIVKDYVGMTNDGYIAVDAYSAATGKIGTYCIGSYNGWKQGDYYYFLTAEKVAESFAAGTVYYVKSYDAVNDVYYVELAGEYDYDAKDRFVSYEVDGEKLNLTENVTYTFTADGYRQVGTTFTKVDAADTYIILNPRASVTNNIAPIWVYTGKVAHTEWTITGDLLADVKGAHVFVNVTNVEGFDLDAYESGLWLYEGGKVLEAGYDAAATTIFGSISSVVEGRYILGATKAKVEALNLYTGKRDAVIIDNNIDLEKDHIYVTVSGRVVEEWDPIADDELPLADAETFIMTMARTYFQDRATISGTVVTGPNDAQNIMMNRFWDSADYLFGFFHYDVTLGEITKAFMDTTIEDDWYGRRYRGDKVGKDNIKFYIASYDGEEMEIEYTSIAAFVKDNPTVTGLGCGYVYDVVNDAVVIYANEARTSKVVNDVKKTVVLVEDANGVDGVDVVANWVYDVYYNVNGSIDHVVVNSVEFAYVGADFMGHNDRAIKGLGFGHLSDHVAGTYADMTNGLYITTSDTVADPFIDLFTNRFAAGVEYKTWDCAEGLCDIVKSIKFNLADALYEGAIDTPYVDDGYVVEDLGNGNEGIIYNLKLALTPSLADSEIVPGGTIDSKTDIVYEAATWDLTTALVIRELTATTNDIVLGNGGVAQKITNNGFFATNPDAIQDTFTAEVH